MRRRRKDRERGEKGKVGNERVRNRWGGNGKEGDGTGKWEEKKSRGRDESFDHTFKLLPLSLHSWLLTELSSGSVVFSLKCEAN
jgi:hypothetical protein